MSRNRSLLRTLPALATITVGAASFALSYVALSEVSAEVGAVPGYMAWLVPIVIDGGIIAGSAVIWDQSRDSVRRQVFPFLFVAALVVVSVVVNINHAADNLLAQGIAALPPLALLGSLELVATQHRRRHLIALAAEQKTARDAPAATGTPARTPEPAETVDADTGSRPSEDVPAADEPKVAAPSAGDKAAPARKPSVAATAAGEMDLGQLAAEMLQDLLGTVDSDAPVKEAVSDVFTRYVDAGGDPYDRNVTSTLAAHFDTTSGYIGNIIRPIRAAYAEQTDRAAQTA